jgi:hypothetical protein
MTSNNGTRRLPRTSTFSYQSLEAPIAKAVCEAATEIRVAEHSLRDGAIAIGRRLIQVKELLPHGEFGKWLKSEFGWAERTAQNYMRVAEAFGENPQRVADLPLHTLYVIAAQPPSARNRVLELVDKEERPAEQRIASIIHADREERRRAEVEEREKARRAQLTEQGRKNEDRRRKRAAIRRINRDEEHQKFLEEEEAKQAATDEAAGLIVEHMGAHLDRLIHLLKGGRPWAMVTALEAARKGVTKETVSPPDLGGDNGMLH